MASTLYAFLDQTLRGGVLHTSYYISDPGSDVYPFIPRLGLYNIMCAIESVVGVRRA